MEETQPGRLEIRILDRGPLVIKEHFTLTGPDGTPAERTEQQQITGVALCRCGKSREQPFCNGTHANRSPTTPS